jgi:hypothetical protein
MNTTMNATDVSRRTVLQALMSLPVLGAIAASVSPARSTSAVPSVHQDVIRQAEIQSLIDARHEMQRAIIKLRLRMLAGATVEKGEWYAESELDESYVFEPIGGFYADGFDVGPARTKIERSHGGGL